MSPGKLICDFCNDLDVGWSVTVEAFEVVVHGVQGFGSSPEWALCTDCAHLVCRYREADTAEQMRIARSLLNRSVASSQGMVSDGLPAATGVVFLQELHDKFWASYKALGMPVPETTIEQVRRATAAMRTLSDAIDAKRVSVQALVTSDAPEEAWRSVLQSEEAWHAYVDTHPRLVRHMIREAARLTERPDPVLVERPWMAALEAQWSAVRALDTLAKGMRALDPQSGTGPSSQKVKNDLAINWERDARVLRVAETYAWYGDALLAVQEAAASVPSDAPLMLDMVPGNGHGFWWFTPPMEIPTTRETPLLHGLLWSVADKGTGVPTHLTFTAYVVVEERGQKVPIPSSMFRWRLGETQAEMLAAMGVEYDRAYGAGGAWETHTTFGREGTLRAISQLAAFFLAGCSWLQQDILHVVEGGVQRHRRKQLQRELKLDRDIPPVKVIALRRSHYEHPGAPAVTEAPETGERQYSCQWVVRGHWRNVACGPGRTEHRLRFIHPYIAGPDDKPLRTQRKVFAVVR